MNVREGENCRLGAYIGKLIFDSRLEEFKILVIGEASPGEHIL